MSNGPMADERETAQWYMVNGGDEPSIKAALKPFPVYRYGSLVSWQALPPEAKLALRRAFYEARITCYQHGKVYVAGCAVCDECSKAVQP